MAVTVLSGTSGALYYKPAGTNGNFPESGVNASTDTWGTKINTDLDSVDAVFAAAGTGTSGDGPHCPGLCLSSGEAGDADGHI